MTELDIKKLREIAKAATPGPWVLEDGNSPNPDWLADVAEDNSQDLAYLASFNPQVALALLDKIEVLKKEKQEWTDAWRVARADSGEMYWRGTRARIALLEKVLEAVKLAARELPTSAWRTNMGNETFNLMCEALSALDGEKAE